MFRMLFQAIRCAGPLYMVNTLHEGAVFTKYYARLEKGMLSLYKDEEVYNNYEAPAVKPFDMSEYRLVTDPAEIQTYSDSSSYGSMRKKISGHANLTLLQSMSFSDGPNLGEAARKYAFNLVPKV